MNSQEKINFARLSDHELQAITNFEYELGAKFGSDVYLIAVEAVPDMYFT